MWELGEMGLQVCPETVSRERIGMHMFQETIRIARSFVTNCKEVMPEQPHWLGFSLAQTRLQTQSQAKARAVSLQQAHLSIDTVEFPG